MSPPRPFAAVLYTLTILAACGHGTAGAAADTADDRADGGGRRRHRGETGQHHLRRSWSWQQAQRHLGDRPVEAPGVMDAQRLLGPFAFGYVTDITLN